MTYIAAFIGAAFAEIAGCFTFWVWLRLDKSAFWLIPGALLLALFAYLLTLIDTPLAGRAYAAYGVYIAAALVWGWVIEKSAPDTWDIIGAVICLIGAAIIILGPRAVAA